MTTAAALQQTNQISRTQSEEISLFAARRAVARHEITMTVHRTLQQLCDSERASIRNHAVRLAHEAIQQLRPGAEFVS